MKDKFFSLYTFVLFVIIAGLILAMILPRIQDSKEVLQGNYRYVQDEKFETCSFNSNGTFTTSLSYDPIFYSTKGNIISFYNPNLPETIEGFPMLPDYQMKYVFNLGKLYLYDVVIQENPIRVLERIR
jgi:hypothetical protein